MSGSFIDSNVFIYLFDEKDERKWRIAKTLIHDALEKGSATISFQVVQETLDVISKKLAVPVHHQDALQFLDMTLSPLWKIKPQSDALPARPRSTSPIPI